VLQLIPIENQANCGPLPLRLLNSSCEFEIPGERVGKVHGTRIEAQLSRAASTMRKVDHGVAVDGRETFRMAKKLQINDATLRFLKAINFAAEKGAEPGV
jgi:hypothetical protein